MGVYLFEVMILSPLDIFPVVELLALYLLTVFGFLRNLHVVVP
jgi:hypothetical protein